MSTLSLVDLAGSESVRHSHTHGQRQIEGGFINKSLLTLGKVVSMLTEEGREASMDRGAGTRVAQDKWLGDVLNPSRRSLESPVGIFLNVYRWNRVTEFFMCHDPVVAFCLAGDRGGYIPYRDSKLTRLLQPSLGGNAQITIICTVTPALLSSDETHNTLKFANRAKGIKNHAAINEVHNEKVSSLK